MGHDPSPASLSTLPPGGRGRDDPQPTTEPRKTLPPGGRGRDDGRRPGAGDGRVAPRRAGARCGHKRANRAPMALPPGGRGRDGVYGGKPLVAKLPQAVLGKSRDVAPRRAGARCTGNLSAIIVIVGGDANIHNYVLQFDRFSITPYDLGKLAICGRTNGLESATLGRKSTTL